MAAGFIWDKSVQAEVKETSSSPFANISLRYSFSNRHQAYLFGSYYIASPTGEYRNSTLIQQNKLMSYTGNQYLTANHHYEAAFNYTWLPSNKLNITAFSQLTSIGNRYSYRYEANATGIRRTIDQPVGAYTSSFTGANATLRLFNNSVNIMGYAAYRYTHDGLPNNFNKSYIDYQLSVAYYVGNWDFLCFYTSKTSSSAGPLTGVWAKTPDSYTVQVGYGNSDWSISAYLYNFLRWNWRDSKSYISTPNYSSVNQQYNVNSHAFVYLSASYTFGFGKKINHENEATQQKGAASGILK
jgi:hypothetical protein